MPDASHAATYHPRRAARRPLALPEYDILFSLAGITLPSTAGSEILVGPWGGMPVACICSCSSIGIISGTGSVSCHWWASLDDCRRWCWLFLRAKALSLCPAAQDTPYTHGHPHEYIYRRHYDWIRSLNHRPTVLFNANQTISLAERQPERQPQPDQPSLNPNPGPCRSKLVEASKQ